jgi:hypothetical protein
MTAATTACSDAAQADPQSVDALYALAMLYDQACEDGPLMETLKTASDRSAKFDGSSRPLVTFYVASEALQHHRLQEADAATTDLLTLLSREGARPMEGAHLLRAAVLLRLVRNAEAEREIEAELAAGAKTVGGLNETVEAAALRGLQRLHRGELSHERAASSAAPAVSR